MKFTQTNTSILYRLLLFLLCVSASLRLNTSAEAQIKPVYDRGAMGLGQLLKRINTTASVLMIGAHPDDEDTALLTYLARGESARTAYLSLTRGDGGQNIIGPELGEALGVIRTEELLQARKLDGAEQFFTRAYDYGFSKTLDEAKAKWDEKIVLCDVVRVIREFRPLVVVSQFSGIPADGHGHHQFAGYISPIAIKAAADQSQCSETGPAWQVKKFYVRHGFRATGEPTLRINTGKYDPLLGRSYFEIAMEARSQHKSQEQGVLELKGEQYSSLNLIKDGMLVPGPEGSIFDGLDTSTNRVASAIENLPVSVAEGNLSEIGELVARLKSESAVDRTDGLVPILFQLREKLSEKINSLKVPCANQMGAVPRCPSVSPAEASALEKVRSHLFVMTANVNRAIQLALGIQVDVLADRDTAVWGESFQIAVRVFAPNPERIKIDRISVSGSGLEVKEATEPVINPRSLRVERALRSAFFTARYAGHLTDFTTAPQWLSIPREGALFRSLGSRGLTLPFDSHSASALLTMTVDGKPFGMSQQLEYRYADDVRGEIRRELSIVPRVSINLDQDLLVVPRSDEAVQRELLVKLENNSIGPVTGTIKLNVPRGWSVYPVAETFSGTERGRNTTAKFVVTIPKGAVGSFEIGAEATINGSRISQTMKTIAYPHIQTRRFYTEAVTQVKVFDFQVGSERVGYIRGSGDRVPDAIKQIGLSVEEIEDDFLATGDLSKYETIIVGIRAYQVRPDLVANNKRLLDFANNGGTLIVQYQLFGYAQQNLMPYPAQMGPRVADENAKVAILQPEHPIFNFPNKITDADFSGWVQERNLYNFSTMDAKYTGLLESHDAGEAENKGGLVVADVGKGKYIYCSYSLFRQLPAGVPGAYRLLANMLSFSKAKK